MIVTIFPLATAEDTTCDGVNVNAAVVKAEAVLRLPLNVSVTVAPSTLAVDSVGSAELIVNGWGSISPSLRSESDAS